MNNFKLNVAIVLTLLSANVFAARDFSKQIPFYDNVIVHTDEMLSAYIVPGILNGQTIVCTAKGIKAVHGLLYMNVSIANFNRGDGSTQPGNFELAGQYAVTFVLFNATPISKGYNSTIRFTNVADADNSGFTVNCVYQ